MEHTVGYDKMYWDMVRYGKVWSRGKVCVTSFGEELRSVGAAVPW